MNPCDENEQTEQKLKAENTHHRGKYHCTAELLFEWFGLDQTSKYVANLTKAMQLESKEHFTADKQKVSRTVILPLKLAFSAQSLNREYTYLDDKTNKEPHALLLEDTWEM